MHRCRPAVSEGSSNILDRYNIAPSTAASTSSPSPRLSTTPQPRRPARPLPEPLPGQIPIDGARPHGGPRVPSWEAFRRRPPRARANSYDGAGIRNPSPKRTRVGPISTSLMKRCQCRDCARSAIPMRPPQCSTSRRRERAADRATNGAIDRRGARTSLRSPVVPLRHQG